MENYLWQKTLLDLYQHFGRVVMVSDNKFNRVVASSLFNHNTAAVFDELLILMKRKNNCLLAKELVDKAFEYLADNDKNILCDYYKHKMPFKRIAEKERINIRQVFRNYDKELSNFAYFLSGLGYNSEVIEQEFGNDNLFTQSFDRIYKKAFNKTQVSIMLPQVYNDDIKKSHYDNFADNENYAGGFANVIRD